MFGGTLICLFDVFHWWGYLASGSIWRCLEWTSGGQQSDIDAKAKRIGQCVCWFVNALHKWNAHHSAQRGARGVPECHKPLAKVRQRALTPVRMADVHTTRQGGTWGHGIGRGWLVQAVPPGHGRKQTEAFLSWAASCTHHNSTYYKHGATLKTDKTDYKLIMKADLTETCAHICVCVTCYCMSMYMKHSVLQVSV